MSIEKKEVNRYTCPNVAYAFIHSLTDSEVLKLVKQNDDWIIRFSSKNEHYITVSYRSDDEVKNQRILKSTIKTHDNPIACVYKVLPKKLHKTFPIIPSHSNSNAEHNTSDWELSIRLHISFRQHVASNAIEISKGYNVDYELQKYGLSFDEMSTCIFKPFKTINRSNILQFTHHEMPELTVQPTEIILLSKDNKNIDIFYYKSSVFRTKNSIKKMSPHNHTKININDFKTEHMNLSQIEAIESYHNSQYNEKLTNVVFYDKKSLFFNKVIDDKCTFLSRLPTETLTTILTIWKANPDNKKGSEEKDFVLDKRL